MVEEVSTDIKQSVVSVSPDTQSAMEGTQRLAAGCTGTSCNNESTASISAGKDLSCALLPDTRIQCWGSNFDGKLGDGSASTESTVAVTVKSPYSSAADMYGSKAVSVGGNHACALMADGQVVCWGDNANGQLGDGGASTDQSTPVFVKKAGPTNLTSIVSISAGENHTCAVDNSGNAWCWGQNTNGQLGDGTQTQSDIATKVQASSSVDLTNVYSISAGVLNTCAVVYTETAGSITSQKAMCWGDNSMSQIGYS